MSISFSRGEGDYPPSRSRKEILAAASEWAEIVHDSSTLLMLDIDNDANKEHALQQNLDDLGLKGAYFEDQWASKSGNTHILIRLAKPLPTRVRYGLQAILGSDPKREAANLRDLTLRWEKQVLFKPKSVEIEVPF